jgi:tetratricopeptide (TPR) repeat protein
MKTLAHTLKSPLLHLLPVFAALALAAYMGLQDWYFSRLTSSDMVAVPVPASAFSLSAHTPEEPTPVSGELSPPDGLALGHEHLSRINHLARARTLRELGDHSGALTECRRALYDTPDDEAALRMIGRLGQLTGQEELAVLAFGRLGYLLPDDASPLIQQARVLTALGRYAEAVNVAAEALLRDSEDPEAYQALGRAHLAAGNLPEALQRFQQAVHLAPEHGYALNNLGLAYLRANQNAQAAEVLARAAALLPHVAYVHNNLGVAYERLGRTGEAQAAYSHATRLSPRYLKAHLNASRMNKLARLDVSPSSPREGLPPGHPSEDTGL